MPEPQQQEQGWPLTDGFVRRAILESIDIPVPPIEIQKQVAVITTLMVKEQVLYKKLAEKRKYLMTEICLNSIRESR